MLARDYREEYLKQHREPVGREQPWCVDILERELRPVPDEDGGQRYAHIVGAEDVAARFDFAFAFDLICWSIWESAGLDKGCRCPGPTYSAEE